MPDVAQEIRDHPPKRLMGYYDICQIPLFLAANGKRPVHLTYDFSLRQYTYYWEYRQSIGVFIFPPHLLVQLSYLVKLLRLNDVMNLALNCWFFNATKLRYQVQNCHYIIFLTYYSTYGL